MVEYLWHLGDHTRGVIGVDVGASSTTLAAVFDGNLALTIRGNLGGVFGGEHLIEQEGAASLTRWIPEPMEEGEALGMLINRASHPTSIHQELRELWLGHALAREAILSALKVARRGWRTGTTQPYPDLLPLCDTIVVRGGVGLDNIDTKYATSKGVSVRNTPKASSNSVAELALGYMLALARRIPQSTMSMTAGEWKKKQLKGSEIAGKTLGLIGYGNIGGLLGRKASALGMAVIFYDVITPPDPGDAKQVSLDDVLAQSDFISLHVPKVPATTNMLNAEAFAKMKDGVYIVNCARGGVVDEDALYDALASGKVSGAALDVFLDEKVTPGNPKLFGLKDENGFNKVIGSPHIGAGTFEGQKRVGAEVAQIAVEFAQEGTQIPADARRSPALA